MGDIVQIEVKKGVVREWDMSKFWLGEAKKIWVDHSVGNQVMVEHGLVSYTVTIQCFFHLSHFTYIYVC